MTFDVMAGHGRDWRRLRVSQLGPNGARLRRLGETFMGQPIEPRQVLCLARSFSWLSRPSLIVVTR
jgi:hypothetical protein